MASIFIVDDDKSVHRVFEKILQIQGHQIVGHAFDGDEAVKLFNEFEMKPNFVLMDHRMPVKDGLTATKEILKIDNEARIIFVSADDTIIDEALSVGALHFLVKPIRSRNLSEILRSHVPEGAEVASSA
jgi:two-component system chemotaxis response regulator CheY